MQIYSDLNIEQSLILHNVTVEQGINILLVIPTDAQRVEPQCWITSIT